MLLLRNFEKYLSNTMSQGNDTIFSFALHWGFLSQICNPHPTATARKSAHLTPVLLFSFPFHPLLNFPQTIHVIFLFYQMYFLQAALNFCETRWGRPKPTTPQ